MKYEAYTNIEFYKDYSVFYFISTGKNGRINKKVEFSITETKDVYNLSFGDVDTDGNIDDFIKSNNGDRNKILATIVEIIKVYTEKFPTRWILFSGSTVERTRLYRMAVGLNFEELSEVFNIYAVVNGVIVSFEKNMHTAAFLIKRKTT